MKAMRAGIRGASLLIAGGFIQLIVCLWVIGLSDQPGSDAEADRAASVGQSSSHHPVYHALNRDFNCSRHNVFAARAAYREVLALIELELYRA